MDLSVTATELEAGIRREKEIVEQLAEMEDSHVAAADPKKGKGAKAGKETSDETLKKELESIR